ncbi:hypothetical protein ABQD97_17965, partial [Enterococcus avium]
KRLSDLNSAYIFDGLFPTFYRGPLQISSIFLLDHTLRFFKRVFCMNYDKTKKTDFNRKRVPD